MTIAPATKKEAKPVKKAAAKTVAKAPDKKPLGLEKKTVAKVSAKGGAKKTASRGAPKAAAKTEFKGRKPAGAASKLLEGFGYREGSNKYMAADLLAKNAGSGVTVSKLLKEVYKSANAENRGALQNCMRGLRMRIKREKLPLQVVLTEDDKGETCFGLYAA